MNKKTWIILAFLAALFAGLLLYGVRVGDPTYVRKNAENVCFS